MDTPDGDYYCNDGQAESEVLIKEAVVQSVGGITGARDSFPCIIYTDNVHTITHTPYTTSYSAV